MKFCAHFPHRALTLVVVALVSVAPGIAENVPHSRLKRQIMPVVFEPNVGQADPHYQFVAHQNGFAAAFTASGVDLSLASSAAKTANVRIALAGAAARAHISAEDELPGKLNFLRGPDPARWQRDVPTYSRIRYRAIYPGIDLLFYGNGQRLEHDFVVSPGADPEDIAMQVAGAKKLRVTSGGDLILSTASGQQLLFHKPYAYQVSAQGRTEVTAGYRVHARRVQFVIGSYDRRQPLVIDPVLDYSTYLADDDSLSAAVAVDAQGNTYVTGLTFDPSYPTTTGAFQTTCASCTSNSNPDVFVTKLKADGTGQVYSTFLGGSDYDHPWGIAVDGAGNAIVVGLTRSTDFPQKSSIGTTLGYAVQYGFITSLSADGSALNYSSIFGAAADANSSATTTAMAVALDSGGNAYVTGTTDSPAFPVTTGALKTLTPAYPEYPIYVAKFLPDGSLGYSAIVGDPTPQNGGGGPIGPRAIAVDGAGAAYVYGKASPRWPITSGAYQATVPGAIPYAAPFVSKLAADGSALVYSTFVGNGYDIGGIAVDSAGNAILTGSGADSTYPVTSDALFPNYPTGTGLPTLTASWLTILNSSGTGLAYSSFLSTGDATGTSIARDASGDIWVGGTTTDPKFPLLHPVEGLPGGRSLSTGFSTNSGFITEFDSTAKTILFSTYFGGQSNTTRIGALALDSAGHVHITGYTLNTLYTTPGAFQPSVTPPPPHYFPTWPFAASIDPGTAAPGLCVSYPDDSGVVFFSTLVGTTSTHSLTITNCGTLPLSISSIATTDPLFTVPASQNLCTTAPVAAGATCTVQLQFMPTAAVTTNASLLLSSNAPIPSDALSIVGTGTVPVITLATTQLPFDPMLVGQSSPPSLMLISNAGRAPLTIDLSHTFFSGDSADFSYTTSGCDVSLSSTNQYCEFFVTFRPTAPGSRQATLHIASNDPANPTVAVTLTGTGVSAYPTPSITQLNSPTVPVGTAPFTIDLYGTNFFPASVIRVNGQAQPTTYLHATELRATVDPSLRTGLGELQVTVLNPAPGGGESSPVTATLYQALPIDAVSLISVPSRKLLYASVPANASANPNTVIPIDPATGTTKTPIAVGNDPRQLAASDDGSYLYVALNGAQQIQRINLATSTVDRTFNLPVNIDPNERITDMHVVPGTPTSVVIAWGGMMALFGDNGLVNAVPSTYPGVSVSSFAFGDASTIYALPITTPSPFFTVFTLDSTGLHYTPPTAYALDSQTGAQVITYNSLLYTSAGQVWDPSTKTQTGTFPVTVYNSTSYPNLFTLTSETGQNRLYLIGDENLGSASSAITITAYDSQSLQSLGTIAFPQISLPTVWNLNRWGIQGLAFVGSGAGSFDYEVYLLSSSLVPIPALTPAVVLSPSTLSFAGQDVGTISAPQVVTMSNPGQTTVPIASITIGAPFSETTNCGTSLAAGASCEVYVTFAPTAAGTPSGALTISNSTSSEPPPVTLSGTATEPTVMLGAASGGATSATVASGQTATYQLSVAGTPGFSGAVSLACTGAPANATCSVSPSSLTVTKGGTSNFTVSVATQLTTTASLRPASPLAPVLAVFAFLAMPLFVFAEKRSSKRLAIVVLAILCLAIFAWTGCGGGGAGNSAATSPSTQPLKTASGTYTLTVTATSASGTVPQKLTLIVQ